MSKNTYIDKQARKAEQAAVAKYERKHKELTERYEAAKKDGDHATALKWSDRIDRLERAEEKRVAGGVKVAAVKASTADSWGGTGDQPDWWGALPFFPNGWTSPEIEAYNDFMGEFPLNRAEAEALAAVALASCPMPEFVRKDIEDADRRIKEYANAKKA